MALALTAGIAAFAHLSSREGELKQLTLQRMNLDTQMVRVNEDAARIEALSDWTGRSVVWLDEIYDLTHRVPDHSAMRVTMLTAELTGTSAKAKDKSKDKSKKVKRS